MDYTEAAQEIIDNGMYNVAVGLMDDDLREDIHSDLAPCTELAFLTEYMIRHEEKYGKKFEV